MPTDSARTAVDASAVTTSRRCAASRAGVVMAFMIADGAELWLCCGFRGSCSRACSGARWWRRAAVSLPAGSDLQGRAGGLRGDRRLLDDRSRHGLLLDLRRGDGLLLGVLL